MMLTMIPKINLCLLSLVLTAVTHNRLLPTSYVTAESNTNTIRDGRRLDDSLPERTPRIHGGWDTKEDRYSYAQVNLKYQGDGHQCGGSLVAPDMVLTAGHCFGDFDKIEIGKYEKTDVTDLSEEFEPAFEILHPDYDEDTTRYDVMLVKLKGTSTMATPVRINRDEALPANGSMLTVIGMGYNANWDLPSVFQETSVQYQSNDQCDDIVDEHGITLNGDLYPDMLCAGYDGRDSCYGDSGSPLVLKGDNEQEDVQIGLVSWGYECAGTLPGIYSRLSYLPVYNFVEQHVCLHSDDPPDYMDCEKWSMSPTSAPSSTPTTKSPTTNPTTMPPSVTLTSAYIESAGPTTARLKEALAENIFLHESDLKFKSAQNVEDVIRPIALETSSAFCAISCSRADVATVVFFGVIWTCMLF